MRSQPRPGPYWAASYLLLAVRKPAPTVAGSLLLSLQGVSCNKGHGMPLDQKFENILQSCQTGTRTA